jgi:hypothetical protein
MTRSRSPEDFKESELKHLEFIQNVIERQARNSFLLKGWSVTLIAAILALAVRNPSVSLLLIASFLALVFWGLDAFYLGQERNFRDMYKDVIAGKLDTLDMDPSAYENGWQGWLSSLMGRSVWPFHLVVVGVVVVTIVISSTLVW